MDTLTTILHVLRALLDAAFRSGAISDAEHAAHHASLNAADPAVAEAAAKAEYELTDAEQAELARLQAKQAGAPAGGTEAEGFNG